MQLALHQQPVRRENAEVGFLTVQIGQRIPAFRIMQREFYVQPGVAVPALLPGVIEPGRIGPGVEIFKHNLYVSHR
ncbi:hypothetical protein D3C81_2232210 [compost metagenome]